MSPFTSDLNIKTSTNSMMIHAAIAEMAATAANVELVARGNATDNDSDSDHDNMSLMSRCRRSIIRVRVGDLMSYQNMLVVLTVLVCGLATVNGLKCHMCGQYNEGVGSITPCLNYSDQYAHLYLKECSKKSEKYCVSSLATKQCWRGSANGVVH
ncbi:uncharacterized protein LOC128855953 [Anastrepha ludens]|uniref:uncharacterized protein LOC128855953 n=1 Tax=Anastrepha ludens TaxID=28586 RepID=UPI0023B00AA1|nr:uncharacterized protein LOC128855953 [Anastrepha ludens]